MIRWTLRLFGGLLLLLMASLGVWRDTSTPLGTLAVNGYAGDNQFADIFRLRPDGQGFDNLTNTPNTHEFISSSSPDGEWLLFYSVIEFSVLQVQNPAKRYPISQSNVSAGQFSWSPDSRYLAWQWFNGVEEQGDIMVFDTQTQTIHELISLNDPNCPAEMSRWSHDGKWLYFQSLDCETDIYTFYRIHPDGSERQVIRENFDMPGYYFWSWDGAWLYYFQENSRLRTLSRMSADGQHIEELADFPSAFYAFGRTKEWIYGTMFKTVTARASTIQIYRMRWDGTELQELSNVRSGVDDAVMIAETNTLYFSEDDNLYRMQADGSSLEIIANKVNFLGVTPEWVVMAPIEDPSLILICLDDDSRRTLPFRLSEISIAWLSLPELDFHSLPLLVVGGVTLMLGLLLRRR